jgi:hypothetical protein
MNPARDFCKSKESPRPLKLKPLINLQFVIIFEQTRWLRTDDLATGKRDAIHAHIEESHSALILVRCFGSTMVFEDSP